MRTRRWKRPRTPRLWNTGTDPFMPKIEEWAGRPALISLQEIATSRGQSLAQMALAWVLRNKAVTSTLVGASSVVQLEENVKAVANLSFSEEELSEIDKYAVDSGINLQDWAESATLK